MPLTRYLQVLAEHARGENLPPNHVPSTFLFAFAASRIVGRVSIRHELNEFLMRVGGHIGYAVVPEFRRQGYATAMLRLSLQIARDTLGIERVLVTCDDDNVGSIRTIEKNGGVLENVISGPEIAKATRRTGSRLAPTRDTRNVGRVEIRRYEAKSPHIRHRRSCVRWRHAAALGGPASGVDRIHRNRRGRVWRSGSDVQRRTGHQEARERGVRRLPPSLPGVGE